jgi:hypothetical protein
MTRSRVRGSLAALLTAALFGSILFVLRPTQQGEEQTPRDKPPRPPRRAVATPANLVTLTLDLALKDETPTPWGGEIKVSEGRVLDVEIVRSGPNAGANGNRWHGLSRRQGEQGAIIFRPTVLVSLDAPPSATVNVQTRQGKFAFKLAAATGDPKTYLDGQVRVQRQLPTLRLTGKDTEDDFPALAAVGGDAWLAYVEYQPGKPIVKERVQAGNFDELVPTGNGDRICLVRFDGKTWHPALDVTEGGLDVWRPTVAVDGKGNVHVIWSQRVEGDWELFTRRYTPDGKGGKWSAIRRLTNTPGADFNVVATTDSAGNVWLAWQAWRKDNFDILAARLGDGPLEPRVVSDSKANDWSPAIAADAKGNVYVAWDTYDKGNYDVRLRRLGKDDKTWTVAGSARFEARPSLVCDGQGRVWIAYEEGDEQWGKDYSNEQFKKIGFKKNPGFGLYINRTIKVKCLANDKLMRPGGDLEKAVQRGDLRRNKSVPRLAVDKDGGIWLLFRHHPLRRGNGEAWQSYAVRHDGTDWSAPRLLPGSTNLLDNRPALATYGKGVLAVYSGDARSSTTNRKQDDLFALLLPGGAARPAALRADEPAPPAAVPVVHKDERADITRLREHRVEAGGKTLRLLRGEFHRHTEYSSHRDQDGVLEDTWRYALDAGALDWMGNGDHDNGFGSEYMWWQIQKVTDIIHAPPYFVAAMTYERSVVYPNGHRNVMMPRRGIRPLPRGETVKGSTPEKGTPDTKVLYAYLKHFGGICSSHTSATDMGTDWRDNNPEFEPVVEIYQGHRHNYEHLAAPRSATKQTQIGGYRPAGFVWNALEKGYRLGFQSSSDHISTHMSYGIVLAEDASRQGLIDAFKKRHCYAATDNILLEVRSRDHLMGDVFTTARRPTLEISIHGTGPVAKVHVIRDNKYVYTSEPKKAEVKLRYTDMDAQKGKTSYYYVRIEQADGNLAWASPMWITWKP